MIELIAVLILIGSIIGLGMILFRKIPVLVELPEIAEKPLLGNFWQKLKEKIKNLPPFKSFSSEVFIQKLLSKIRILTLRIENKIAVELQKLREKGKKKNLDSYWQELKKSKDKENNEN